MSRLRATAFVAVLAAGPVGLTTMPALAMQPPGTLGTPGSSGIGDAYFPTDGNGGYDVTHYGIHDTYRIKSGRLTGWTDIRAVASKDLSSFNLDLVLAPDAVSIDGLGVTWKKPSRHELVVTPRTSIAKGARFKVRVRYHGTPQNISDHGIDPWISGNDEAMAMNEPQIAPWWFPANDHPRDKATFDISVKVPKGQQLISNGELVSKQVGERWSRWHWRMSDPMAPYLAFFAAGRFQMESGVSQGLPYTNAVSKGLTKKARVQSLRLLRRSPGIVRWLEGQCGPYPFTSTGGVTTALFSGFALENQSRPTYPYLGAGRYATSIVVHELAHQWFGDDVSVQRWRDIWLNEGFASFVEWKYAETHGGADAQQKLLRRYNLFAASDSLWKLNIANPGARRIFAQPVYDRGAMALQALRHRIGNAEFRTLMRDWASDHAGDTVRVGQFKRLAEQVSGEDLDGFFDAWLHGGSKPKMTVANGLR